MSVDKPSVHAGSAMSVYVHIPFCARRCHYCHFQIKVLHPDTNAAAKMTAFTQAVRTEISHQAAALGRRPVGSIYFGGGTPSRLPLPLLSRILHALQDHLFLAPDCEISLEANPEDVSADWARRIRRLGITRLSLGMQTFFDPSLRAIGRGHTQAQARAAWSQCPSFGHGRSVDLLLGLPHQSQATIDADLEAIEQLDPEHLSVYMLDRDLPTPLDKSAHLLPDDDSLADWYACISDRLTSLGYAHYEISNFAKPEHLCRHNLNYWNCGEYLGIGPAAHGRIGPSLTRNHDRLGTYLQAVAKTGSGQAFQEPWTEARQLSERLIQGLRTARGVPKSWAPDLPQRFNVPHPDAFFIPHPTHWRLTRRAWLLSNELFVDLL